MISSRLRDLIKMKENKIADLSMDIAVKALELTEKISGHNALKNQFERSSTSIGANAREANYAQSKADFISKLKIALKECYETEFWLELFEKSKIVRSEDIKEIKHLCGQVRKMLISSINTLDGK